MKKSDLKTGMLLKFSNGHIGVVYLNTIDGDVIGGDAPNCEQEIRDKIMFCTLGQLTDDLKYNSNGYKSKGMFPTQVVKIYINKYNSCSVGSTYIEWKKLIWDRYNKSIFERWENENKNYR